MSMMDDVSCRYMRGKNDNGYMTNRKYKVNNSYLGKRRLQERVDVTPLGIAVKSIQKNVKMHVCSTCDSYMNGTHIR